MTDDEILSAEVVENWQEADIGRTGLNILQDKVLLAIGL